MNSKNPNNPEEKEPSKKEILEGIKQGFKEAKLERAVNSN